MTESRTWSMTQLGPLRVVRLRPRRSGDQSRATVIAIAVAAGLLVTMVTDARRRRRARAMPVEMVTPDALGPEHAPPPPVAPALADGDRDALELLGLLDEVLGRLLRAWEMSSPTNGRSPTEGGAWDRGAVGKLLAEHAATRLAAEREVAAALERDGDPNLAREVSAQAERLSQHVDALYEASKGLPMPAVATDPTFDAAVAALAASVRADLDEELQSTIPRVEASLSESARRSMRNARSVRAHAVTHPGAHRDSASPARARMQAALDRFRGNPWLGKHVDVDGVIERTMQQGAQ